ncbi:MAG: hypothetical protein AAB400_00290 [Patescibacteria group bacterium]
MAIALSGILAVLLQSAASATTLRDIGMGQSLRERLITAPALANITTIPPGMARLVPSKDGVPTYRILLGPNGYTDINAVIGGKVTGLRVGNYPFGWKPANGNTTHVVAAASGASNGNNTTMVASSGGSQPSSDSGNTHPSYGNVSGFCCNVELQLGQDLTTWNPLNSQLGGSTSAGSADLKGGVRIDDKWTLMGGLHTGYSRDNSWGWRDKVASDSVVAGPLVGLRFQVDPSNQLEAGVSYDFLLQGDSSLATNPVNIYTSWNGDHGRWYHRAKIASSLPNSSNGARFELGIRPLSQLPQLNVHVVGQGRQLFPAGATAFDPTKHLKAQAGVGLGFDVTDSVTAGLEILAPSKPGDNVSLGLTTSIHF